ncbi:MAG: ABC transporter ATP-binding protein [Planctomycetia bacterium]|nr:ABC transporter ATP-binding protein [Planctomycetia bacterium]
MPDLVVRDLTKTFPSRSDPVEVLRGVSLSLSAGENLAVLGPSGSGKSTLLYIIGTLDEPTAGTVELFGENPFALSEPELARFRNERIGFVFQDHHLLPQCTVLENVLLPTIARGASSPAHDVRARKLLDRVGLGHRLDHRPAEISGGERQRAAIARALVLSPRLLLTDEPTGNLDRASADAVGALLLDLQRQENLMLLVVTHSQPLAGRMSRRLELSEGKLIPAL